MNKRQAKKKSIPVIRGENYPEKCKGYMNEFIKSDTEQPCCVCNKMTNLIEINYQAPFCGDECVNVMDKASVTGKRNPLF